MSTADELRQHHRQQRAALSPQQLQDNALGLLSRLSQHPELQKAQHVAAYIAIRGEISLATLMEQLANDGKQLYLPILRAERMHFAPWQPEQKLHKKGFGLLEPEVPESQWRPAEHLDLVLAPLVVFDPQCNRIGQGGGYYDRCFAFKRQHPSASPTLLGVAHQNQLEPELTAQPWDVRLDLIVTEQHSYYPGPKA